MVVGFHHFIHSGGLLTHCPTIHVQQTMSQRSKEEEKKKKKKKKKKRKEKEKKEKKIYYNFI
jgi:hypothetical protein